MMNLATEIRLNKEDRVLHVTFDDGSKFSLPAEYLRVESPSAEVRGHGPQQKQVVSGKLKVTIVSVEAVGNYAIRLSFDDGHDTGIYSWDYLYDLGRGMQDRWSVYLADLDRRGLTRVPQQA